jgi:hypothetical protein
MAKEEPQNMLFYRSEPGSAKKVGMRSCPVKTDFRFCYIVNQ